MPLDSIRAGGAFVRAHDRHAVKFSRRIRALGRHRGAFESAVSTRCSGGLARCARRHLYCRLAGCRFYELAASSSPSCAAQLDI